MTTRVIPLLQGGRPTTFMIRQWTQKGGLQPLRLLPFVGPDRTATDEARAAWKKAFPTRQDLPNEAIVDAEGRATNEFWRVWA